VELLVVIVLFAGGGKVVGAGLAARLSDMSRRDSATVGVLASARGATELVVLQIGMQLGVINAEMLVLLTAAAMLMTVAVGPMVVLLRRPVAFAPLGGGPASGLGVEGPVAVAEPVAVADPLPVADGGVG